MPTQSAAVRPTDPSAQLVDRCDNWGDVMRWKIHASVSINGRGPNLAPTKVYYARIGGLESQYRSPQRQHWQYGSAPTQPPDPDQEDAMQIERAVCTLDLYHHSALRYHHVNLLSPPVVLRLAAKAAGIPRSRSENSLRFTLQTAYGLLQHALTLPAVIQKARALERVQAVLGAFDDMAE
jgi:hypothetical protein